MAETPGSPPAATPTPVAAAPVPKGRRPARILAVIGLVAVAAGGWFGWDWWVNGRFTVSTDDAYVKADTTVLAAKIAGYVTQVVARDNAAVKAGDLLAKIDDGDYRLAVDSAAARVATQDATIQRIETQVEAQGAAVEQARAQLSAVEADTPRVEAALARAQRLLSQEFTSQAALDTAKADRERNRAQIAQARAAILGAEAQTTVLKAQLAEAQRTKVELEAALDRARRDLAFTEIRAPIDGVVGNRAVQVGQYVQAGTRLLALVDTGTTYVEANLKETQLARIAVGEPATVAVDAFGGRVLAGRVDSISPASGSQFSLLPPENATGNFTKIVQRIPVRIRLDAETLAEGRLRPGMSVVVSIRTDGGAAPSKVGAVAPRSQPADGGRALTARSAP